jgi:hypothetical protein
MNKPCHLVVDVQVLMTASGITDPPDDGSGVDLLNAMRDCPCGRLVWDSEGLIRSQYEQKLNETTFAREWLGNLLLEGKLVAVDRATLTKAQRIAIMETGLVGEDLQWYVRTAAKSPENCLVSHDSDYDNSTRQALKKQLDIKVRSAGEGSVMVKRRSAAR